MLEMTYTRKRLIESQISLWKDLREDYTRYRDAEIQSSKEWHTYNNIIKELNEKLRYAEIAWKETEQ